MNEQTFAEVLKRIRMERNLSQLQLAEQLYIDRSTIARWENGKRLPDHLLLARLADCLNVDISELLTSINPEEEAPNVILLDDERIILSGSLPILEEVLPQASITGFTKPSEAIAYAKTNRIALAFLDIEMGMTSGLDVCRKLMEINARINVIFLTAYMDYSFDAWSTGASGFLLKPLTTQNVKEQLSRLRYPVRWGGSYETEGNL